MSTTFAIVPLSAVILQLDMAPVPPGTAQVPSPLKNWLLLGVPTMPSAMLGLDVWSVVLRLSAVIAEEEVTLVTVPTLLV